MAVCIIEASQSEQIEQLLHYYSCDRENTAHTHTHTQLENKFPFFRTQKIIPLMYVTEMIGMMGGKHRRRHCCPFEESKEVLGPYIRFLRQCVRSSLGWVCNVGSSLRTPGWLTVNFVFPIPASKLTPIAAPHLNCQPPPSPQEQPTEGGCMVTKPLLETTQKR